MQILNFVVDLKNSDKLSSLLTERQILHTGNCQQSIDDFSRNTALAGSEIKIWLILRNEGDKVLKIFI